MLLNNLFTVSNPIGHKHWKPATVWMQPPFNSALKSNDSSLVKRHRELPSAWFSWVKKDLFSNLQTTLPRPLVVPHISIITDVSVSQSLPVCLCFIPSALQATWVIWVATYIVFVPKVLIRNFFTLIAELSLSLNWWVHKVLASAARMCMPHVCIWVLLTLVRNSWFKSEQCFDW